MKPINVLIIATIMIVLVTTSIIVYQFREDIFPEKKLDLNFGTPEYFTDDPNEWVRQSEITETEKSVNINTYAATRGDLVLEDDQQNYFIDGEINSFMYYGSYDGYSFGSEFLDDKYYEIIANLTEEERNNTNLNKLAEEHTLMKITNQFDANDGVINAFVMSRLENKEMVFYLFVDQDWKDKLEFTNVFIAEDFLDPSTWTEEEYDFSNYDDDVYIKKITENIK
jgi:hypothetical protein